MKCLKTRQNQVLRSLLKEFLSTASFQKRLQAHELSSMRKRREKMAFHLKKNGIKSPADRGEQSLV